jgi:ribokinase
VDTSSIQRDPARTTGLIFIPVTEDGERTMFSFRGANVHLRPEDLEKDLLEDVQLLHISGYNFLVSPQRETTQLAVARATARGIPISLDVGVEPAREAREELLELMPHLSLCVLGGEESRALIGTSAPQAVAADLLARGVQRVGYKLGAAGCLAAAPTDEYLLPGFEVDTVDTTGAGDAFCAGFIYGWVKALPLPAVGLLANAMGALATMVWGAGPALPGQPEAIALLQEQGCLLEQTGYQESLLTVLQTLEN